MEVSFRDSTPEAVKAELVSLPVSEEDLRESWFRRIDRRLGGRLSRRMEKVRFDGAPGSVLLQHTEGQLSASHLLLIGMGKRQELEVDSWRRAGGRTRKEAGAMAAEEVAIFLPPKSNATVVTGPLIEGVLLASYQFNKYRSNTRPAPDLKGVTLCQPGLRPTASARSSVRLAQDLVPGVFLARDLVNEPPSVTTARYLGDQAVRHCKGRGLRVEVWGKKKIEAMKLAGLLAVNRGSTEEPRFISIRYKPSRRARRKVALIGKGITFDSGGLSLKSAKSMETMKLDMSGAAAIIGALSVVNKLNPPVEVVAYIPCTDNLPSGSAQKPGDVIRYLNGKTAEVVNTDAEGRLILADGLALAAKEKPDCMMNLATLTGACMVALGTEVAGIFGNRQSLVERVIRCSREAGEKLWQLPLVKEYREDIKSSVADIKNVGGSYGGAITAALFLQEFVGNVPWVHLDIAGPAFLEKDSLTCAKGGTGFGVLTILKFLSTFK